MNVSGRNCPAAMIALTHELITRRTLMNKLLITTMSLTALGLIFAATNVATAAEKQKSASRYECFTDDGYGRKLPCSYGYKLTKRADGAGSTVIAAIGRSRRPWPFTIRTASAGSAPIRLFAIWSAPIRKDSRVSPKKQVFRRIARAAAKATSAMPNGRGTSS